MKEQAQYRPLPPDMKVELRGGSLPKFGTGVETTLLGTGLKAGGNELVVASAQIPVTHQIPVRKKSSGDAYDASDYRPYVRMETVTTLTGIMTPEVRTTGGQIEETVVDNPGEEPYFMQVQQPIKKENVMRVRIFRQSLILSMDKETMVRLHVLEDASQPTGAQDKTHTAGIMTGVIEVACFDGSVEPTYTLADMYISRQGDTVQGYRVLSELPFEKRNS